jgi:hypothetical protein
LNANEGLGGLFWPALIVLAVVPAVLWLGLFSARPRWQRATGVTALLLAAALPLVFVDFSALNPFAAGTGGRRTHRLIVLDGSFSMAYRPGDESRFERAQEIARSIVRESLLGDGYTLILMSEPPRVVVGTPVFDKNDFTDEINKLRPPHAGGDLAATLAQAQEVLETTRRDQPKLARHEVHLVSDLGRTSWHIENAPAQATLRQQASKLSELAGLVVYDVGQPEAPNLAVAHAVPARLSGDAEVKFATTRRGVAFRYDVRNFGSQEQTQQVVELWVDGARVDSTTIDVPGHGQASGGFNPYRFEASGEHAVEIRLAADALPLDNSRWLSVPVKPQLRVLCIDGKPSQDFRYSGTGFLVQALRDGQETQDGQFVAEVETERALRDRDLSAYDAVFLCNVAQFNQEEAAALHKFVLGGGGLVTFLGEKVRPESYNQWLGGQGQQAVPRILPARLRDVLDRNKSALSSEDAFLPPFEHEIVRIFGRNPEVRFAATPVTKWYRLELADDQPASGEKASPAAGRSHSRAVVALRFVNNDPAIAEERIGRGRSILVATSADLGSESDRWSYMPSLQNFLPLVRELLSAAVVGQFEKRNLAVGEPLSGSTGLLAADDRVEIKTPWHSDEQVPIRALDDHGRWNFGETDESGIYQARVPVARGSAADAIFAANVNTAESDLAKVSHDDLRSDLLSGVPITYLTSWQGLQNRPAVVSIQRWFVDTWLLSAVCGLLLLETLLAWWFGRHGS